MHHAIVAGCKILSLLFEIIGNNYPPKQCLDISLYTTSPLPLPLIL